MNNPINIIKMLKEKANPQQMVMNILGENKNPMINNLVKMAQKGDVKGVEQFARNLYKEHGKDFDKEFNTFMNNFK